MASLLVLITDEDELISEILDAWEGVGVPGVTTMDTRGSKHQHNSARDDLPFIVSLRAVLEAKGVRTKTLFSVIQDPQILDQAVNAVLQIIPDFAEGHRGIMFTTPLHQVWGFTGVSP